MKAALRDPWSWLWAALLGVSLWSLKDAPSARGSATAASAAVLKPVGGLASSSLAPGSSLPAAGAPLARIVAKTPGRWLVDAAGAADADSKTLAVVLASAKAGDTVILRPGTYREDRTLDIAADLTLRREPNATGDVLIVGAASPNLLAVRAAKVALENIKLTREPTGDFAGTTLSVSGAEVSLKGVTLSAREGAYLDVRRGRLTAEDSTFRNDSGKTDSYNFVEDAAVDCRRCVFERAGLNLTGRGGTQAEFTGCVFRENGAELTVKGTVRAKLAGTRFEGNGPYQAVSVADDGEMEAEGTVFSKTGGDAVFAGDSGKLTMRKTLVEDGHGFNVFTISQKALVTLADLKIRDATGYGINTGPGTPTVEVSDCAFSGIAQDAVYASGGSKVALRRCVVSGGWHAINAAEASVVTLASVRFERSGQGDITTQGSGRIVGWLPPKP